MSATGVKPSSVLEILPGQLTDTDHIGHNTATDSAVTVQDAPPELSYGGCNAPLPHAGLTGCFGPDCGHLGAGLHRPLR